MTTQPITLAADLGRNRATPIDGAYALTEQQARALLALAWVVSARQACDLVLKP